MVRLEGHQDQFVREMVDFIRKCSQDVVCFSNGAVIKKSRNLSLEAPGQELVTFIREHDQDAVRLWGR